MDRKLLALLVCPATRQPLSLLTNDQLSRLNQAIAAGSIVNAQSEKATNALTEALITKDGKTVYRVDDGIPVLLTETAISTLQIPDWR